MINPSIAADLRAAHPDWDEQGYICRDDLAEFRAEHVARLLERERGELTNLERDVVESLRQHEILAADADASFAADLTFGERLADRIATFGGSWKFLIFFACVLAVWVVLNTSLLFFGRFDPYPFILLNLVLSCLAAIQAPVIMMSQNRQESKDRVRSETDYKVNLKAELEIRHLHDKIDHLLSHQWERMVEVQRIQLELLDELSAGKDTGRFGRPRSALSTGPVPAVPVPEADSEPGAAESE